MVFQNSQIVDVCLLKTACLTCFRC